MQNEVYQGQIIRVTEEKIGDIIWERVYLPAGVVVFPITNEGKIILIKEQRPHENPPVRIKPVSGILEPDKGSAAENAQRELREEIGLRAEKLELLWTQKGSGTVNHEQHYFIARDLIHDKLHNPDGEEMILGLIEYTPQELFDALIKEEIRWSMSTLGIFRLLHKLNALV